MKQIFTAIFFGITIVSFTQGTIKGRVIDSTSKLPLAGTRLTLLTIDSIKLHSTYDSNDYLINQKSKPVYYYDTSWKREKSAYADSLGYYQIDCVEPNYYKVFSFFQIKEERGKKLGEGKVSDLFLISGPQDKFIDFQLGVFCSYDATKDLVECPKCHKREGVRIQVYGLPSPDNIKKSLQDDGKHYYKGYCVVSRCHPTKICLRCKAEF